MPELAKGYGLFMVEEKVTQLEKALQGPEQEKCAAVLNLIVAGVAALDEFIK